MAVLKLRGEAWIAPPQHAEPRLVQHVDELIQPFFQLRRVKLEAVKEPLADLFRRLSRLNDSQFDRMEYLDLSKSSIADLALLKGIFGLEELRLVDCELDDQKLSQLPAIPTLKRLILDGNDLRAPSVFYLATTHPQLEELSLACPNVDSSALLHLPWFKQLKRLSLAGSAVTDSGLKRLARLTTLEALDLRQTKVTPAGITELQQALPKCKIAWDGTEKD
jgi:Leucine-rich repeat (LRR) protein